MSNKLDRFRVASPTLSLTPKILQLPNTVILFIMQTTRPEPKLNKCLEFGLSNGECDCFLLQCRRPFDVLLCLKLRMEKTKAYIVRRVSNDLRTFEGQERECWTKRRRCSLQKRAEMVVRSAGMKRN